MKRYSRLIGVGVIAVIVVIVIALGIDHSGSGVALDNIKLSQAKKLDSTGPCAANNDKLKISKNDLSDIQMVAITHIVDVPAGTKANINIASYSSSSASGSVAYHGDYGAYNFRLAKKQLVSIEGNRSSWVVTGFSACEK